MMKLWKSIFACHDSHIQGEAHYQLKNFSSMTNNSFHFNLTKMQTKISKNMIFACLLLRTMLIRHFLNLSILGILTLTSNKAIVKNRVYLKTISSISLF